MTQSSRTYAEETIATEPGAHPGGESYAVLLNGCTSATPADSTYTSAQLPNAEFYGIVVPSERTYQPVAPNCINGSLHQTKAITTASLVAVTEVVYKS